MVLEDALKTDGVMCIDELWNLWASVVIFPHNKETKIALPTHRDIANSIVTVVNGGELQGGMTSRRALSEQTWRLLSPWLRKR